MFIFMTTFYVDATYTIIIRFFKKISTDATIVESIEHITQGASFTCISEILQ